MAKPTQKSVHRPTTSTIEDRFLTTEEVADRYRTSPETVRYWRHTGTGPTGVKIGVRVLYRESECLRWEQELEAAERA